MEAILFLLATLGPSGQIIKIDNKISLVLLGAIKFFTWTLKSLLHTILVIKSLPQVEEVFYIRSQYRKFRLHSSRT